MNDLEMSVLAVITRHGPRSAYSVREEFRASFVSAWSASTGSIYPAVRRLLRQGDIRATEPKDRRGTRLLQATAAGRTKLERWIRETPRPLGAPSPDPIRTRLQHASLLRRTEALSAVESAITATRQSAESMRANLNLGITVDEFEYAATTGCLLQLQARLAWLELMRAILSDRGLTPNELFARAGERVQAGAKLAR